MSGNQSFTTTNDDNNSEELNVVSLLTENTILTIALVIAVILLCIILISLCIFLKQNKQLKAISELKNQNNNNNSEKKQIENIKNNKNISSEGHIKSIIISEHKRGSEINNNDKMIALQYQHNQYDLQDITSGKQKEFETTKDNNKNANDENTHLNTRSLQFVQQYKPYSL